VTGPTLASSAAYQRGERNIMLLLLAPAVLVVTALLLAPLLWLAWQSVYATGFTFENYARIFNEALYWRSFLLTFRLSFEVTVFTLLMGYPVAYAAAALPRRWSLLVLAMVIVPFWTSVLVRSYAWLVLLQRTGVVNSTLRSLGLIDAPLALANNEIGTLIATVHILLPFMVLPLYAALRAIPDDYVRAARMLGAGSLSVFRHVVLPLSLSGISSGCLMVFLLAIGFFVTPALIGGPQQMMLATLVQQQVTELLNWPFAGALVGVLLAFVLVLVVLFNRVVRLDRFVGQV
jgi:putative spermidine/putrescine transport system permease protein